MYHILLHLTGIVILVMHVLCISICCLHPDVLRPAQALTSVQTAARLVALRVMSQYRALGAY